MGGYSAADTRIAGVMMAIIQVVCWIGLFNCEYGQYDAAVYEMYMGIALMMLVGFGYLMTFLKLYGMGAVGFTFIITVLAVQINILLAAKLTPDPTDKPVIDGTALMDGNFGAATILISYGCMIGKASPAQLVILTVIESVIFQVRALRVARNAPLPPHAIAKLSFPSPHRTHFPCPPAPTDQPQLHLLRSVWP